MTKKLISVSTGQSAGEAFGYSNRVVKIRPDNTSYELTTSYNDPSMPPKRGGIPTDQTLWEELAKYHKNKDLISAQNAGAVNDFNDAGTEWIEFELEDRTIRIENNPLEPIEDLQDLFEVLRNYRHSIETE